MKTTDLLDLTVRELLEEYCVLFSPECAYIYGVTTHELADEMYNEWNIEEEYPECMCPENLISDEVWDHDYLIDKEKIKKIMEDHGINKKRDVV